MNTIASCERIRLSPIEERTGKCRCRVCTEKPRTTFYTIGGFPICQSCVEESTVCLDFDEPMTCTECGETCEEWITLAENEALCPECLHERRITP